MIEEWKDVIGAPGYKVSNLGNILGKSGKLLTPVRNMHGYLRVHLSGHVPPSQAVHVLVLKAFVGPRPEGMQTRHLNGKRDDNRLANLAWGSAKENSRDRITHGTLAVGDRHGSAKLTPEQVQIIRTAYANRKSRTWGAKKYAREFGVARCTIKDAIKNITWKCLDDSNKTGANNE